MAVEKETFDFSTKVKEVLTQSGKRWVIYHYPKLLVENFICHYLKKRLDKVFKIEYASRSKIINLLFNTIPALKNMNDFVIIRADFKEPLIFKGGVNRKLALNIWGGSTFNS